MLKDQEFPNLKPRILSHLNLHILASKNLMALKVMDPKFH